MSGSKQVHTDNDIKEPDRRHIPLRCFQQSEESRLTVPQTLENIRPT